MVSLKDIAAHCSVSVATVSKALNNHKDVSNATKETIHRVAKEMGYFPNSQARALKTNRTYNLGVMFLDAAESGLTHDFFARLLNSFKTEAEEAGYDITFINRNTGGRKMTTYEHCKYRNVDGVIIACIDFKDPDVYEVINGDIPVVTIDHIFDCKTAILSDNRVGMRKLLEHVIEKGHRKIAYIQGNKSSVAENRLAGFIKTLTDFNIPVNNDYIETGEYRNAELAGEITSRLLNLPDPPTCIFMPDDYSSMGGMNMIKEHGLSVPDDVSIVGYDGLPLASLLTPKLTTYWQDTAEIGRIAAKQLINLIEKPTTTFNEVIYVDGRVILGDSVKDINA